MALLPTIPTSFVPHQPSVEHRKLNASVANVFNVLSYAALGIVFLMAIGVFSYGRILASTQASRDALLAKAESSIDTATIEGFVQLRDRLNASQTLLKNHVAFSNFFSALQTLLPLSVRFTMLHVSTEISGAVRVEGVGVARSFNSLSAASSALTSESHIKDVIFSKMSITRDGAVSFGFSATLDPRLIAFSPKAPVTTGATPL